MNKGRTALALFFVLLLPLTGFAEAPHQLGGFVLGDEFSKYQDLVDMQTKMPLRHSKSIDLSESTGCIACQISATVRPSPGQQCQKVFWIRLVR